MLNITEVTPEICHLHFRESDDLVSHFIRFSEYYEGNNPTLFRNKFTVEEALDIYNKHNDKNYFEAIDGFNVPVSIMSRMANDFKGSLNARETFLLSLISVLRARPGSNIKYLIGTCGPDGEISQFFHELAHAFYYTNEVYRMHMDTLIRQLPPVVKSEMHKFLEKEDYNPTMYDDETQAYMATGLGENCYEVNNKLLRMFRSGFVDLFLEALAENDIQA